MKKQMSQQIPTHKRVKNKQNRTPPFKEYEHDCWQLAETNYDLIEWSCNLSAWDFDIPEWSCDLSQWDVKLPEWDFDLSVWDEVIYFCDYSVNDTIKNDDEKS
jgi:hypothetical protein